MENLGLEFIKVEIVEEGIAVVTLNRPPVNAFNLQMYRELHKAFQYTDDPANQVRCVIVNAIGKMFSPGNDVKLSKTLCPLRLPFVAFAQFRPPERLIFPGCGPPSGLKYFPLPPSPLK